MQPHLEAAKYGYLCAVRVSILTAGTATQQTTVSFMSSSGESQNLISVVVVNWNGEEFLTDCLDECREQVEQGMKGKR